MWNYERSKEMATINTLTWDEAMQRIDNDETFMFMVTFEGCTSCEYFVENVLSGYLKNHGFELNIINIMKDEWSGLYPKVSNFIKENPYTDAEFKRANYYDYTQEDREMGTLLTPTIFFVRDGEVKDKLLSGNISLEDLDSMIVNYRLDEVK